MYRRVAESVVVDDQFKKHLLVLIDEALDAAHTAGMESAAEMEGCSWTGNGVEKADLAAGDARQSLMDALGFDE